jgi:cellulose synthase/poly-beta-1,6-N-acetylglucosamine synthase-like glycosyltransferase
MGSGIRGGAVLAPRGAALGRFAASPSIDPSRRIGGFETAGPRGERHFPEIDCIRALFSPAVIAAAEQRAEAIGIGADRVLIASGRLDEEAYLRILGETLGIAFEPLDGTPRTQCPLENSRLIDATVTGLLPLTIDDGVTVVVAPRDTGARKILELAEDNSAVASLLRLTSTEHFNRFVLRTTDKAAAARAADTLREKRPMLSAASSRRRRNIAILAPIMLLLIAGFAFTPRIMVHGFELVLATVFIAWLALRLTGAFVRRPKIVPAADIPDDALPVYTVVCALYQEASSVNGLLSAIERLDYPAEKLDVILAVEADDHETRAAIAARKSRLPVTLVPVAAIGPRTKPKALNVALPFARGDFTVVYDAEDRPEPGQLRCALQAFRADRGNLACVQARLCIDNTADSLLAGYFTAEYAGQFDVFLLGLAALKLPLPLGGSSNHFRTTTLRTVGGWDAYNVTEDADLGVRLARFGYRADIIESTTYEEAPTHFAAWLPQRTRWFKGWMQTWLVHMREPGKLLRELGLRGFLAFQLMIGGSVLAALVHPSFMAWLIYCIASGGIGWRDESTMAAMPAAFYAAIAVFGYLSSAFLGWLGLSRRGLSGSAWVLLFTPVYWLMLSLAAWRALYQLFFAPYRWEKTAHGLAKSSHRANKMTRALLDLKRDVETLKKSGKLPVVGDPPTYTSAVRRRRLRGSVSD